MTSSSQAPRMTLAYANAIAQALEKEGLDSKALFNKAGIPYHFSADPSSRMETRKATELYKLAIAETNNPAFGLKVAAHMLPITLYALGYSIIASNTLLEFFQRLENYFRLVSDNANHQLVKEGKKYYLHVDVTNEELSYAAVDCWTCFLINTCRNIYRPNYSPVKVELIRPKPASHAEDFTTLFKAPVVFSAPRNTLVFNESDVLAPLPMGDADLARRNDEVVLEYLARLDRNDIVRLVEAKIVALLPTGDCSKERVASELNMSLSSLYNKLEQKNTNYQHIIEELRAGLARQYVCQNHLSINQITYLLGFSDTSNFSRAFRRWTGQSPTSYRRDKLDC